MKTDEELSELIPLYIIGKLGEDERRELEKRLVDSAFLKEELGFWEGSRVILKERAAERLAGHPTNEEMVAFVDRLPDLTVERRFQIETHVGSCKRCREKENLLKSINKELLQIPVPVPSRNLTERTVDWLKGITVGSGRLLASPRVAYAGVGLAILLLVGFPMVKNYLSNPSIPVVQIHGGATLAYGLTRGGDVEDLRLDNNVTDVDFTLTYDSSDASATSFRIALKEPSGSIKEISAAEVSREDTLGYRALKVSLPLKGIAAGGTYTLIAYSIPLSGKVAKDSLTFPFRILKEPLSE